MADAGPKPDVQAPRLTLATLGAAEIIRCDGDERAVVLGAGKPVALLVYLSASPGRTARREHLLDLLWSDVDADAGRHALRQLVWYVRQRLGEDVLGASRDALTLAEHVTTDREELLAAADAQDCDRVIELYRGEFLPNLALPGGGEFEQWADLERQRLRAGYLRCGDAVARRMLAAGRYREAVTLARHLRDAEPYSEPIRRLAIEALLSANDYLGAAAEADALTRFLREENREPETATRAMIRRASATPAGNGGEQLARGITAELVGRSEEFGRLVAAWNEVRKGRHRHLHLSAAAGIGKTRLLADFTARLRAKGASVASVAVRPGDRQLAQSAMGDLAAALAKLPGAAGISPDAARCVVALHPPLSSAFPVEPDLAAGDEGVRRRVVALHELISAVADDAPVAILVDDLHWMDDVSRQMLTSILQRIRTERVLVVTAARPRYAVARSDHTTEMTLHPLVAPQVGALLASVAALPDEQWAERFPAALHHASSGSPLLVLETLQMLMERDLLALGASGWACQDGDALLAALASETALGSRIARLNEDKRGLLAAIAVAGVPVPRDLLHHATGLDTQVVDQRLATLEQRGFVLRADDAFEPAHDTTGEFALAVLSDDALRATHGRLGRAYLATRCDDMESLLRAGRHFAAAGDTHGVREAFRAWLLLTRRDGDSRSIGALAREFAAGDERVSVADLVRSAPLRLRYSRRSLAAGAAAALVVLVTGAVLQATLVTTPRPPDATLLVMHVDSTGDTTRYQVPIRRAEMSLDAPIVLRPASTHEGTFPEFRARASLSPDGRTWIADRVYPDSGGFDILRMDAGTGREVRLTAYRTDESVVSWSPDGRHVVFQTGRFDPLQHFDLAIMDPMTGWIRQLTSGSESNVAPAWHPSGTVVAFVRHYWDRVRPDEICTVTVDGIDVECVPLPPVTYAFLLGWFDDDRLVMRAGTGADATLRLYIVNLHTRELRPIGEFVSQDASLSPDGRWVVCRCRPAANPRAEVRTWVFPVDDPSLARVVEYTPLQTGALVTLWAGPPRGARYLDTLQIGDTRAVLGAPTHLAVRMRDARGLLPGTVPLRWESVTPDIATIDRTTGILRPRRTGVARIRVSAGGWRTAERDVAIVAPERTVAFREDWSGGLTSRFTPFGDPLPFVAPHRAFGKALRVNGDDSFPSGVYSTRQLPAAKGLGAAMQLSAPFTMNQWQLLSVGLLPSKGDATIARWDHHSPRPDIEGRSAIAMCALQLPDAEGPGALEHWGVFAGGRLRAALPPSIRNGTPFELLLQLFPDGSCGAALDGTPVAWVSASLPLDSAYRVLIEGQSYRTDIAVGAVEVWTGVKPGIDWLRARVTSDSLGQRQ